MQTSTMTTSYFLRIPLPLAKPRDHIVQCVRIFHDGADPGGGALATALRRMIKWAEHHEDEPHPKLPGEWTIRSYLRRPIDMENKSVGEVLVQLEACGCQVRVVTTRRGEHPTLYEAAQLFRTPEPFSALTTEEPQQEWLN